MKMIWLGAVVAGALALPAVLLVTIGRSTAPPPDPFPGEMFELSYDRHANTPKWVRMCEAKLEWRLKDFEWKKQNSHAQPKAILDEQITQTKAALDASRAGKRCELPKP